jgi:hypothetical protein
MTTTHNNNVGTITDSNRLLVYKYEPRDLPLTDCPTVFFHIDFIHSPVLDWVTDWTGAPCEAMSHNWRYKPCMDRCMKGVLMKYTTPCQNVDTALGVSNSRHTLHQQRVWRLTGNTDVTGTYQNPTMAFEGKWPD